MMFNYLFPIFCFGLVMTGIVFLGILEAAKQVKAESSKEHEPHTRNGESQANSIVLMASAVAQRGMINHEAIAAAKAGVVGLAQSAAATYARFNIRVNCVAPGLTRTPLTESLTKNEASLMASAALHPLGRIGEPHEVASAIAWLLDPEQSWVTGQVIAVDGGLSSVQPRTASLI